MEKYYAASSFTFPPKRTLLRTLAGMLFCVILPAFAGADARKTTGIFSPKASSKLSPEPASDPENPSGTRPETRSPAEPKTTSGRKLKRARHTTAVPTIAAVDPTRNRIHVPAAAAVSITFSEAMEVATASNTAIRVYGSLTGKRSGTFGGAGTAVATFAPNLAFKPGETVSVITTTAARNAGGTALARAHVYTFTAVAAPGPAAFIANPAIPSLSRPHAVYAADYDGDGDADLAIANSGSSFLTIQKNNGGGTFTAPTNVAYPGGGESIFAADLDGDGDLDLATANKSVGSVSIRFNDGTGAFSALPAPHDDLPTAIASGSQPSGIHGADFDGDGDVDLIVANKVSTGSLGELPVFINDGTGRFTRTLAYGRKSLEAVCTADFDGDGDVDFAASASSTFNQVSVRLNNGDGTFPLSGPDISVGTYPQSVYAADFDGDGDVDLATANRNSNNVSIRLNNGNGTFAGGS